VLGRREALVQGGEILGLHDGLAPQALDERVVADVARVHLVDVALARVGLGVQPPQLHILVVGPLGHDGQRARTNAGSPGRHLPAPTAERRWRAPGVPVGRRGDRSAQRQR
jgi:hypothetical protein